MLEGIDVVGMARTGSGKTAAFVIPMIEKLKQHSAKVGARALILSPSRELALQTLKVVKEFGKGTDLKCVLLVGGDSLEDQFSFMAGNPDVIIATPGRFLHLQVEMSLSLSSIQYVVFDEADRLFEMGFASQLTEILHALPPTRQTLLFSATLPRSLVDFAKAGLQEPHLVRLDADSKISQDLESAFFTVKSSEKEGSLIHILQEVIKVPKEDLLLPQNDGDNQNNFDPKQRKRKRLTSGGTELSSISTIIFVATKHHVEYIARLLHLHSYPVSYVYGSLDQTARRQQVDDFRSGKTKILVVTDVAARGIDIPIIANVINYDFPPQPKVFIHRVGRTARAGKRGWAYSLVRAEDAPYLLDLQLFLGRKLVFAEEGAGKKREDYDFASDVIVGTLQRDAVEACVEKVIHFQEEDSELHSLHGVAVKGEKLYQKTKITASVESNKRAKEVVRKKTWTAVHPLFSNNVTDMEHARLKMLAKISDWRPKETIFEIGQRGLGKNEAAETMRRLRQKIKIVKRKREDEDMEVDDEDEHDKTRDDDEENHNVGYNSDSDNSEHGADTDPNMEEATEADLTSSFITKRIKKPLKPSSKKALDPASYQDPEFFMSYTPKSTSLVEERGYSVSEPVTSASAQFALAARNATFDLTTDDGGQKGFGEPSRAKPQQRWDKKAKKFVSTANDEDGSKGKRMIIGESGQKIAASFKSGRFEKWKTENRVARMPKVGEQESGRMGGGPGGSGRPMGGRRGGRMYHSADKAPKEADKYRNDYEVRKKRVNEARERMGTRVGGAGGAAGGRDLKTKEQIRRDVKLSMRRKEKSNRPSKKTDERRPFKPKSGGKNNAGGGGGGGGKKGGKVGKGGKGGKGRK